jgi:hypothetical protein
MMTSGGRRNPAALFFRRARQVHAQEVCKSGHHHPCPPLSRAIISTFSDLLRTFIGYLCHTDVGGSVHPKCYP